MPIVERVFVPSRSRAEGPGAQPPARGCPGEPGSGGRAAGCSGRCRCRRHGAAAARCALKTRSGPSPLPPPRTREAEPRLLQQIGPPGLFFPLHSGADVVPSLCPREESVPRARSLPWLPAEVPEHPPAAGWATRTSNTSHGLQHHCQDAIVFCRLQPGFIYVFIYSLPV